MPVKKIAASILLPIKNYLRLVIGFLHFNNLKWLFLTLLIGISVGSASAFFLVSLDWATHYRERHLWIIAFLPVAGLLIGLAYHYWGKNVVKGNNLLIEELQTPRSLIPFVMAPLVYAGTIITHLFGGSAGREGTAVQIGGAFADQLTKIFKLKMQDRKMILICGISAGFASVFGTPLAGAVFGLEVFVVGNLLYNAILPAFLSAIIADYVCKAWGVGHTHYNIALVPDLSLLNFLWALASGIIFGLAARFFSVLNHSLSTLFAKINYPPLRPVIGGLILIAAIYTLGNTQFIGLGIPTIVASFSRQAPFYAFAVKIFLTTLTLSAGFKGGEVTPLFFIGATLGSFLSVFMPLPVGLLAGMGFVAVFSGAANTPLACIFMGMELFGAQSGVYIALACVVAYLFSGHKGIYQSQTFASPKHGLLHKY